MFHDPLFLLFAINTIAVMHGPQIATIGTTVFFPLLLHKNIFPVFFDVGEVVEHAHVVVRPVSFVQSPETPTRKFRTFEAIPLFFLASCNDTMGDSTPASGTVLFLVLE